MARHIVMFMLTFTIELRPLKSRLAACSLTTASIGSTHTPRGHCCPPQPSTAKAAYSSPAHHHLAYPTARHTYLCYSVHLPACAAALSRSYVGGLTLLSTCPSKQNPLSQCSLHSRGSNTTSFSTPLSTYTHAHTLAPFLSGLLQIKNKMMKKKKY